MHFFRRHTLGTALFAGFMLLGAAQINAQAAAVAAGKKPLTANGARK